METWSLVIPCLNEAPHIRNTLKGLQDWRKSGHEIILVDGGSHDGTEVIAKDLVDKVVQSIPGRGHQLRKGASEAIGSWLLFLHADSQLPKNARQLLEEAVNSGDIKKSWKHPFRSISQFFSRNSINFHETDRQTHPKVNFFWGRFDIRLGGKSRVFRLIETLINWRSSWTSVCTGDQGIFVHKSFYQFVGGFPPWPLMEDIELSKRLKRMTPAYRIREPLVTSSRRWEHQGVLRTILKMWWIRLAFFMGVSPFFLANYY